MCWLKNRLIGSTLMTNRCFLFALGLLATAAGCHRENPSAPPASSTSPSSSPAEPVSPQLAQAFDRIIDQQRSIIALSIRTQLKRVQGNATEQETQKLADQVVALLWSGVNREHVTNGLAQIYQEQFSAAQLSEIAAFYATPSGQAVLAKTPAVQAEFSTVMMGQLQAHNPKAVELMNQFAQAHNPPAPAK
jgi:hypothetical protein